MLFMDHLFNLLSAVCLLLYLAVRCVKFKPFVLLFHLTPVVQLKHGEGFYSKPELIKNYSRSCMWHKRDRGCSTGMIIALDVDEGLLKIIHSALWF